MCGRNHIRYISLFIILVFVFIALCSFAQASNTKPVKGTNPKPAGSTPTSSKPAGSTPAPDVEAGTPPSIASIVPNEGRPGDIVKLLGANFGPTQGTSRVKFGSFKVVAEVYPVWSDGEIQCAVPPISGGPFPEAGPVVVETPDGTSNAVAFTIIGTNPTISSISPGVWSSNSSTVLTIAGTGFQSGVYVRMKPPADFYPYLDCYNVVVVSSEKITCTVYIPKWGDLTQAVPSYSPAVYIDYRAIASNPDGGQVTGGAFRVVYNICGGGALAPIVGFGIVMGFMTLAGTIRGRRRRTKKS